MRTTVAGDDAALYNSLLLTMKDAAQYQGRKSRRGVLEWSGQLQHGPARRRRRASAICRHLHLHDQHARGRLEPVSTAVFDRMSAATGGKAYFAKSWRDEKRAFASIRDDLAHLYSFSYYPQPNPNRGWRAINVKLWSEAGRRSTTYARATGIARTPNRFSAAPDTAQAVPPEPASR